MALVYQEYYTLGDYRNWEGDWELIEGMPYAMAPSPSVSHQTVSFNLASLIKSNISEKNAACSICHVLMETDWQKFTTTRRSVLKNWGVIPLRK